jgi:hypothetical protein
MVQSIRMHTQPKSNTTSVAPSSTEAARRKPKPFRRPSSVHHLSDTRPVCRVRLDDNIITCILPEADDRNLHALHAFSEVAWNLICGNSVSEACMIGGPIDTKSCIVWRISSSFRGVRKMLIWRSRSSCTCMSSCGEQMARRMALRLHKP